MTLHEWEAASHDDKIAWAEKNLQGAPGYHVDLIGAILSPDRDMLIEHIRRQRWIGMSYSQIAEENGISKTSAHQIACRNGFARKR